MSEVPDFQVGAEYPSAGQVVVQVVGELDAATAPTLELPILEALAYPLVVLDLSRCAFCDSSGLRRILDAAHHAHLAGHAFRVAGVDVAVRRVFELAGVQTYLNLYPDVKSALAD